MAPKFLRLVSGHNASKTLLAKVWKFAMDECENIAEMKKRDLEEEEKAPPSYQTIVRDLEEKLPEILVSCKCVDPEHDLVDAKVMPVVEGRKILVESAYIQVCIFLTFTFVLFLIKN